MVRFVVRHVLDSGRTLTDDDAEQAYQLFRQEKSLDPRTAPGARGLGPADPARLRRDVVVEAAAYRVLKDRDDADLGHDNESKTNQP